MINVLLVDDHTLLRQSVRALIDSEPDLKVIAEAGEGCAAVELALLYRPDVVIMDITLPGVGGADATRRIRQLCPQTRVQALSARHDVRSIQMLFEAGASGYLMKECAYKELLRAIRLTADGVRYLSQKLESDLLAHHLGKSRSSADLTQRERQVLQMIADGQSVKQVAIELRVSIKTVETHRRSVMEKLRIFNIAELTKHAIRQGISSLD